MRPFIMQKGFTLVEVLVALLIVAVTLGAGIRALTQATDLSGALDRRMIARWVAEDHIALLRAQQSLPKEGQIEGQVNQAGLSLIWSETSEKLANSPFLKITVRVREDKPDATQLVQIAAFILQSPP
jgi:general secretion pathway protein I